MSYLGDEHLAELFGRAQSSESIPRLRGRVERAFRRDPPTSAEEIAESVAKTCGEGVAPELIAEIRQQVIAYYAQSPEAKAHSPIVDGTDGKPSGHSDTAEDASPPSAIEEAETKPNSPENAVPPPPPGESPRPAPTAKTREGAKGPRRLLPADQAEQRLLNDYKIPRRHLDAVDKLLFVPMLLPDQAITHILRARAELLAPIMALAKDVATQRGRALAMVTHWLPVILGEWRDTATIDPLISLAQADHIHPNTRAAAGEALAKLTTGTGHETRGPEVRKAIKAALDQGTSTHSAHRAHLYAALGYIAHPDDRRDVSGRALADPEARAAIACALADWRDEADFPRLYDDLTRIPGWARSALIEQMAMLKQDPLRPKPHQLKWSTRYRGLVQLQGLFLPLWPTTLEFLHDSHAQAVAAGQTPPDPPIVDVVEFAQLERLDQKPNTVRVYTGWYSTATAAESALVAHRLTRNLTAGVREPSLFRILDAVDVTQAGLLDGTLALPPDGDPRETLFATEFLRRWVFEALERGLDSVDAFLDMLEKRGQEYAAKAGLGTLNFRAPLHRGPPPERPDGPSRTPSPIAASHAPVVSPAPLRGAGRSFRLPRGPIRPAGLPGRPPRGRS